MRATPTTPRARCTSSTAASPSRSRRQLWEGCDMVSAWRDLTFGLRLLLKTPGFTAAAVLTLALGIGANVAVFTIVNAVLFKGLPVDDPAEIVSIGSTNRARNELRLGVS